MTSQRWLLAVGIAIAFTASEVVVAAAVGLSGVRVAILALAASVFGVAYLVTPAPGRCRYDTSDLNPVFVMVTAVFAGIALTGGLESPMLPLLPAPLLIAWTMVGQTREATVVGAFVPLALVALAVMPERWTGAALDRRGFATLGAWSTMMSTAIIGRRMRRQFENFIKARGSLDRVRNGALSDAESRRRGVESMSTKLAHELKNPLAAIKSLVQLELRSVTDERTKRRLDVVFAESERMQTILRDYLSLERPVDVVRLAPVELGELVAEVGELLAGRAEAGGVELAVRSGHGRVVADARLLKEAIVNVAANALQATPRGGTVDLWCEVGPQGATIAVRDSGAGMTPEVLERVGTPFFSTRDAGTGLGIAIARSAVSQHGGTLELASTPGVGTLATIALPRDPCPAMRGMV